MCPVAGECLAYALADPDLGDWWGPGRPSGERRKLRDRVTVVTSAVAG